MCGIAGIVHLDRTRVVPDSVLTSMCDAIRHRGPDDFGTYIRGGVALGHRRLSIIDISSAGHQPMSNEDESVWVVFNGEIYNFSELRAQLIARGHRFRSNSDTEAIVHLYEERGVDCFEDLDGMFAIAIWDSAKRKLVLARDRFGKKPLKFARVDGGLVFASELKAILASGLHSAEVDLGDVDSYLSFGYVPSPGTGFRGIEKLPPGHSLSWQDGKVTVEQYWSIDYRQKQQLSDLEWKTRVRQSVFAAVEKRMVADVPLGAFLSGGIDSSIVVACMSELSRDPIETFSIGFEHETHNELEHARAVSNWCHTSHHEFIVRADEVSLLPELAKLYEEPFADASALPTYFLARETRKFVTVALSGDGGDEGFFGYRRYRRFVEASDRATQLRRVPGLKRALRMYAASGMFPRWARRADFIAGMLEEDPGQRYLWLVRQSSDREKDELDAGLLREARRSDPGELLSKWMMDARSGSALEDKVCFADIIGYLPGQVLPKVDVATMAHGLEARAPLLDRRLVELAASAPPAVRAKGPEPKFLLRAAFEDLLPPGHFDRPKQGFGIPLDDWFRGPWVQTVADHLTDPNARVARYLRSDVLRKIVDQHVSGSINHGHRLWSLLMLELWHREYFG